MNLVMLCTVLLLVNLSYRLWRFVCDQELRWELCAIRDEVRWLAITDPSVRARAAVARFDYGTSMAIEKLESFSIWTLLAAGAFHVDKETDEGFKAFHEDLLSDPRTCALYMKYVSVMNRRLRSRHWPLTVCAWLAKPFLGFSIKDRAVNSTFKKPSQDRHVPTGMAAAH